MKRLLALVLILCCLPIISLADTAPVLPDFKSYSKNQLELIESEDKDYLIIEKFSGSPSKVSSLVESYVTLLTEEYGLLQIAKFHVDYESHVRVNYALIYEDQSAMGSFNVYNEDYNWRCDNCQVFLQYTIVDSGNATMWLYYRPEFNYSDTGSRSTSGSIFASKATAKPTAKPTATPKPANTLAIQSVSELGDGQVQIRWTDSANASPYQVFYVRKLSSDLASDQDAQGWNWVTSTINNKSYNIGALIPGEDYWIWVKDANGNSSEVYTYYAGYMQHFNDFNQKPGLDELSLKQINSSGQKSTVQRFSANTIKNSLSQMDFGAYVQFDYPRFKDEKHYYFQVVLEAPNGWAYVDYYGNNTLPAGDTYSYWTFYSFDGFFENLIEAHGYVPTGLYSFKMFWDGKLVDTATFTVN